MTLKVLNKIKELVNAGTLVIGDNPISSPSLTDDESAFNLRSIYLLRDILNKED